MGNKAQESNVITKSQSMSKLDTWWQTNWTGSIAGSLFTSIDFETLSLSKYDAWWQSVWANSMVGRLFAPLANLPFPRFVVMGNYLQLCSFIGVVILFSILALPQFVNDKEGLALLTLGCAFAWFIGGCFGGKERRESGGIDIPIWLYLAANAMATVSSHYLSDSIIGLMKLIVYIVAYFLFTAIFQQSTKRKAITVAALLSTAVVVVLYGLYQYAKGVQPLATCEDPTVELQGIRIFSSLNNPNLLAGYLVPLVPLAAGMSVAAFSKKQKILGTIAVGITLLLAVGTILTGSRGGYLGLFAGLAAIIYMIFSSIWCSHPSKRKWILVACASLPLMGLALHFVPAFDQRLSSIFAGREHSSNSYRMNVWLASLAMLKQNWWLGVGPGNKAFVKAYGLYMMSKFDALGTYCVLLEVAVEAGIVALASFICLLVGVLSRGHICFWSKESDPVEKWLAGASGAALIAMMAHGVFDTVFYRPQVQFIFWLLVAILATAQIKKCKKEL
jgi:putative inorganic carbon (HCO3(-)) transporter